MSVKYDRDDDEDYVPSKKIKFSEKDEIVEIKKHTLDSDEEDNDKEIDKLDLENIYEEEQTIEFDGETKITPFNLKEEMEEGHFDKDGNYFVKKEDQINDAWLENIDWTKIKRKENDIVEKDDSDSEPELPPSKNDTVKIYEKIFVFLKEGESLAKALRRLGGKQKRQSTADRWKKKKQGENVETNKDMKDFLSLTELCNDIIATGNMDIYQETYEMINIKLKRAKEANKEPELDMFGDVVTKPSDNNSQSTNSEEKDSFDEVTWEYKHEEKIYGPFKTKVMQEYKDSGKFNGDYYVRKVSEKDGPWYNASRIDFELYL